MSYKTLANYEIEQTLFAEFVESDNEPNILLFQGGSGSGKSHLVEHCLHSVPEMPSHLMTLQGGGNLIPTLFTNMGRLCGWDNLPHFTHKVINLLETSDSATDPVWQMGIHRHLRKIGNIDDLESRLSQFQLLSDAWFTDSMQFESPFLLAIDTYENSPTLFDRWFREDFLVGVANSNKMRVLVSGQTVPKRQEDWSFCSSLQELNGVHDAQAWMIWSEAVGYQVPSLEYLAGIVAALKGNPSQIIEVIKTQFPRSNGPIKSKDSLTQQRKRFFNNITQSFSLVELKKTCFFLGIEHENLPNHDQKDSFVIELLGYVERHGRLKELIQECQAERPHLAW